jgi:3-deoxy-D-manno-octulosonic-acid transferase
MARQLNGRPRWLAISTHPGEEAAVGRVHQAIAVDYPQLMTVIVPRHPDRGAEIAGELATMGLVVAQRSDGQELRADADILLADTMGELGLFIRLAPIVFVGKSLIGQGGQNPLEPAQLGASVLFGPNMDNFAEIAARMRRSHAAEQVDDEASLAKAVSRRLADAVFLAASGARARAFALAEDGVLDAVLNELTPWLAKRESADARA